MWTYEYKGFLNCDSKCGVEIKREGDKVTVILTELEDNPGTSVTNMVEQLMTMIYHKYLTGIPVENISWIEHYPEKKIGRRIIEKTFDKVTIKWDGKRFLSPQWKHIGNSIENIKNL